MAGQENNFIVLFRFFDGFVKLWSIGSSKLAGRATVAEPNFILIFKIHLDNGVFLQLVKISMGPKAFMPPHRAPRSRAASRRVLLVHLYEIVKSTAQLVEMLFRKSLNKLA